MKRYLSVFALSASLLIPTVMRAQDRDDRKEEKREHRQTQRERRYYDRQRHDYHVWNSNEDRAYRHYLQEQRLQNLDWNRANRSQQQAYWRWRHEHMENNW